MDKINIYYGIFNKIDIQKINYDQNKKILIWIDDKI